MRTIMILSLHFRLWKLKYFKDSIIVLSERFIFPCISLRRFSLLYEYLISPAIKNVIANFRYLNCYLYFPWRWNEIWSQKILSYQIFTLEHKLYSYSWFPKDLLNRSFYHHSQFWHHFSRSKLKFYKGFEWTRFALIVPYGQKSMSTKIADIHHFWKII